MFQRRLGVAFLAAAAAAPSTAWAQTTCNGSVTQLDTGGTEIGAVEVQGTSIAGIRGPNRKRAQRRASRQQKRAQRRARRQEKCQARQAKRVQRTERKRERRERRLEKRRARQDARERRRKERKEKRERRRQERMKKLNKFIKNSDKRRYRIDKRKKELDQTVSQLPSELRLAESPLLDKMLNDTDKNALHRLEKVPAAMKNASSTYEKVKSELKDIENKWEAFLEAYNVSSNASSNTSLIQKQHALDIVNKSRDMVSHPPGIDDALNDFRARQQTITNLVKDEELALRGVHAKLVKGGDVIDRWVPELQARASSRKFDSDFTSNPQAVPRLVDLQKTVSTLVTQLSGVIGEFKKLY